MTTSKGKVYLVGAGPGDPGLITIKGRRCIQLADVVIYDYLAAKDFLKYAREDAEILYVGKKGGDHTLSQDGINRLLVDKATAGNMVTRLKGGDPFIFGRGGEEAEVLESAGIPFEIVPGVTSAIAAPAYAGIPLTHRDFTSTLAFVTGHEDPTKSETSIDWKSLARGIGTLVFLMGVKNLPSIVSRLTGNGMPADTPAALVRWGTTTHQRTVTGTLENITERVTAAGFKAPAIIVIGGVVQLREKLKWFEDRALLGKRIVVTRARQQASDVVQRLSEMGAAVLECPTIEIVPPSDWSDLDRAIARLSDYQWIVFTSVNGVGYFFKRLFELGKDVRSLGHFHTAAIGPATAARLGEFGLTTDIIPESYRAESVIAAFEKEDVNGQRILLPRAAEARPILPAELAKMGAAVDEITVYQTRAVEDEAGQLAAELDAGRVDMVTFTSSSTVRNFKALIPEDRFSSLMEHVIVASIGPITSDTAKELGFDVHIEAKHFTIPGLIDAILDYYTNP
ncbi:Uroporphyrinogen-III methyltransferase (EC / Uroporphyrinogen-III synthase (EC [Olavius algarvensis associated proteobacterium Delta 3]|nr:Uroporphyrinogen-III methyltransferase (EC / Uroporphyrinogen-III synthase (EC [Olavius algarvensis associated proteobacterium Delta 3]CAB5102993.1 Uroporphyrinogen-III methyltransferase (EC / Uroporphyrinogen-III synthase (EC [Olavius algarvensis associated proteobacterium Delta 3]